MTDQLVRYAVEHQITPAEYQATLMFFADHEVAREYLRRPRSADRAATERYRRACHALGELRQVVLAVVVHNMGVSTWAYEAGLRRAKGMAMLREGLSALVSFYASAELEEPPDTHATRPGPGRL